jgi:phosphohistidine swiveling domain-containing protein
MGGILCHAAIISRELRVPCVIGTEQGSHVLHDGDLVEVDADHGMVRVILSQASFGGSKLKKVVAREYVPLISDLFIQAYADLGTYQKIFLTDYYVRSAYVSGTYNYGPDANGFGEHLYEKSKNEKGYFDTMFTNIYRYGEEVYEVALALSKRDYRDMKKGDVLKLAREFFERYKIFSISLLGFYLESPIEKALRKIAQRADNPDEALSFLSFPEKENLAAFEQENLYKIGAVVVAEKASSYETLSDQTKRLLVRHADEYGWINARGGLDESWSPQDIYDRIVGMDIDFEKESVENIERKKKHSVESEKYLQRLNLSGEEKEIVRVAKELVYFRTYRTDYLNRIISTVRPLLRAVADVYDMSLKDLMRLRVAEILDGTIPTKEEIENRKKDYFLATVAPGSTIFTADRKEIARLKEQYIDQPVKGGEVRGTVAFKGRVQGRVRLVVRRKDFDGVLEGDVLVTAMTTPDMMTIMKKAIAFITDEGGVTCHAAIIAREMRKPCIIGTKIATQVLKDGDLVEVDADHGVVRIIER